MRAIGRELRTLFSSGAVGGLTDGQLLEHFLTRQDEAAFEELVRRHGPMVMGVCRRGLGNHHDAEDAFQATFLVLARNGATVRPREMLAHWLYGVAGRIARKARATAGKRRVRELLMPAVPEPATTAGDPWDELAPVLDQELSRLPERYRVPIVLCDLEGQGRKQAAQQLGWPEGTLSSRLSRARGLLAQRLRRRGIALSGGALAALLFENETSAALPATMVASTAKTATFFAVGSAATAGIASAQVLTLTERMLQAMLMSKLKVMTALLIVGVALLGAGAAGLAGQGGGDDGAQAAPKEQPRPSARLSVEGMGSLEVFNGHDVVTAERAVLQLPDRARLEFLKGDHGYFGRVVPSDKDSAPFEFSFGEGGVTLRRLIPKENPDLSTRRGKLRELEAQRSTLSRTLEEYKRKVRDFEIDPAVRHEADLLNNIVKQINAITSAPLDGPETRPAPDRQALADNVASDKQELHAIDWPQRLEELHRQKHPGPVAWKAHECQVCHGTGTGGAGQGQAPASVAERERKRIVRDLLVRQAVRDIKATLQRLEQDLPDRQTELEALDEIEATVRDLNEKAKERGK